LIGSLLFVLALGGCGDDDDGGGDDRDSGIDGGGSGDSGSEMDASGGSSGDGSGGSSGGGGTGGSAGTDAGDPYQCEPTVPEPEPGGDADEGEACCDGLGVCTKNVSGEGTAAYGLDDCKTGEALKCVPRSSTDDDAGADDDAGSDPALASCRFMVSATSSVDYEGRCIPSCFLTGDPSTANLAQSTCADDNTCVPCYSPITGASTGACNRPGDAPVDPAPAGFAECGDGAGLCVPGGSSGAMLPQLTCDDGQVCAPKSRVLDQGACFPRCESAFGPGACLAAFVVGDQASLLTMATCMTAEVCVPCISPLTQMPTGACN
jgi:hypothetical protein